jgi:hypothetical protein
MSAACTQRHQWHLISPCGLFAELSLKFAPKCRMQATTPATLLRLAPLWSCGACASTTSASTCSSLGCMAATATRGFQPYSWMGIAAMSSSHSQFASGPLVVPPPPPRHPPLFNRRALGALSIPPPPSKFCTGPRRCLRLWEAFLLVERRACS